MERLFRNPAEGEPILDPVLVETLNAIEGAKLVLNDRAETLANRHERLEANLDALRSMLEAASRSRDTERFTTLETAAVAILTRMGSLRGSMQAVSDEIDAIDAHLAMLVELPVPINE
ncbi:MAG: hypothetical protein WCO25_02440 [Candidatus Uhrbacteria bacterium]